MFVMAILVGNVSIVTELRKECEVPGRDVFGPFRITGATFLKATI